MNIKSNDLSVNYRYNQQGFTAIELLITLFIAAVFLMSGYQLYNVIIKDGGQTRAQARASNVVYDYLRRYKPADNSPCDTYTPVSDQSITDSNLPNATITVEMTCPYSSGAYVSKVSATLTYGASNDQHTVSTATYVPASRVCPTGFITVPGSDDYGTSGFCVMKYEAKADDNGDGIGDTNQTTGSNTWPANTYPISATRKLVSTAAGYPVVNISQTTSLSAAALYTANCDDGCHLITEAEWMTIVQNVLSVPSNWTDAGGTTHEVGTGYIYSGHSDNSPASASEADTNDTNGYTGTNGNTTPSNQRRTLTLTNGEVIWDLSGNIYEWSSATIAGTLQPGLSGESAYAFKQWDNASLLMNGLSALSKPSSTGIAGIENWNSAQGIGQLYSNYGEAAEHGFMCGGYWNSTVYAGVLYWRLNFLPSNTNTAVGLRVAQ